MVRTAVLGLPRMGRDRELKRALEDRWAERIDDRGLLEVAAAVRADAWQTAAAHVDVVPVGDASLYDHVLDTAWALGRAYPPGGERAFPAEPRKRCRGPFSIARTGRRAISDSSCGSTLAWMQTRLRRSVYAQGASIRRPRRFGGENTEKPGRVALVTCANKGIKVIAPGLGGEGMILLAGLGGASSVVAAGRQRSAGGRRRRSACEHAHEQGPQRPAPVYMDRPDPHADWFWYMTDGVSEAIARVSYDFYVRLPDGMRLPQSSAPGMIEWVLRLLEVRESGSVLEVGTGSGFSTAVLSHLVGRSGSVISVDIDPDVVMRALDLLHRDGRANVTVVAGDGRLGHQAGAPYDCLVAWASAEERLPESWLDQVRSGGVIVAPLMRGPRKTVVKYRMARPGVVIQEDEIAGSFIPLTATPFRPWEEGRDG